MKKKLVVLSGAGISAESGISTFRDAGGLWEGHDIMEVASPDGWRKNPELVLDFYNKRRDNLRTVHPNSAHKALVELEKDFDVRIITQNVDDLHERAGSTRVMHLHGELLKARSTRNPELVYHLGEKNIKPGDCCEEGAQLRPHIVWFNEAVPLIETAIELTRLANIFVVIGTSLAVYPAASLLHYAAENIPKFIIDPNIPETASVPNLQSISANATTGMIELVKILKEHHLSPSS